MGCVPGEHGVPLVRSRSGEDLEERHLSSRAAGRSPYRHGTNTRRRLLGRRHTVKAEILTYPDVPSAWAVPDVTSPGLPVVPVCFQHQGHTFNYFSTVTVLGTPQDITLQELRIESFFPADRDTMTLARLHAARARDLAPCDGTVSQ